jgi:hypothetical protein
MLQISCWSFWLAKCRPKPIPSSELGLAMVRAPLIDPSARRSEHHVPRTCLDILYPVLCSPTTTSNMKKQKDEGATQLRSEVNKWCPYPASVQSSTGLLLSSRRITHRFHPRRSLCRTPCPIARRSDQKQTMQGTPRSCMNPDT